MIDEKKIEEAVSELYNSNAIFRRYEQAEIGFKVGINWFKENLWHDASEVPESVKEILLEQEINGKKQHQVYMFNGASFFCEHCKKCGVTRWLYINDLMKGGSNG